MHVAELIKRAIDEERAKKGREEAFHVTDLSACPRGVIIKRKTGTNGHDDRTMRVFTCGHLFEEYVVSNLGKAARILETQGRVAYPEFDLVGSLDVIFEDPDGFPHLWDVKSQHSNSFHWMEKRGRANDHHVQQVHMYYEKKREQYPGLKMSLVYVSKDDLCTAQYPVLYDPNVVSVALRRAAELDAHWKAGTLPEPEPAVHFEDGKWGINWKARYCSVHDVCMEDENWLVRAEYEAKDFNRRDGIATTKPRTKAKA